MTKKNSTTKKKTAKKSTAKVATTGTRLEKKLEKTQAQLHALQADNASLKEKLSQLEQKLDSEVFHRPINGARSWDEKVMAGLCRIARVWSDYGPIIIIVLFLLMLVAWIGPWDGLFKFCFTLLMFWLFTATLGVAKSNIEHRFDEALYQIRNKG